MFYVSRHTDQDKYDQQSSRHSFIMKNFICAETAYNYADPNVPKISTTILLYKDVDRGSISCTDETHEIFNIRTFYTLVIYFKKFLRIF